MSLVRQLDWVGPSCTDRGPTGSATTARGRLAASPPTCSTTDLRPGGSFVARLLDGAADPTDDSVIPAITEPPKGTPGLVPGHLLAKWPDAVVTANWDPLVFGLGHRPTSARPYDGSTQGN